LTYATLLRADDAVKTVIPTHISKEYVSKEDLQRRGRTAARGFYSPASAIVEVAVLRSLRAKYSGSFREFQTGQLGLA
jgi:hypothetical protein